VNALASLQDRAVSVLVWNYHDDDLPAPPAQVELVVEGLPVGANERLSLHHYRVDAEHSNSYEVWKKMGSPQKAFAGAVSATRTGRTASTVRLTGMAARDKRPCDSEIRPSTTGRLTAQTDLGIL